ncbi:MULTISPECIES: VOC family protein [Pseudoxanthomonas]|uniref:PhnB protein n=1 Tax=Pseudoxanthomonas winnipegensis TaxID=2480810 RepID=A0AAW8GF52_9GAMM|nr:MULTISPECIES: VOC family protein [Pseudoxanthomonas]MDQ1120432.1 PhnB protein [Pseudoxanthomonas winnipegensis]MDQ1133651.1 PhnB protein [Pseudoxanthomonas winnipegensis]MDR6140109.1 PhnB protein [Pseudoxanthomonas sp. SORGH_AS_0997]
MNVAPYLFFNGNCRDAMRFYAQTLGGAVVAMATVGEAPPDARMPGMPDEAVMHAMVIAGGVTLMASDACPPQDYTPPHGMTVSLQLDDVAQAERLYAALAEGAQIQLPLGPTFWSPGFAMLTDRFGTPWMLNVVVPAPGCEV